jgi:hypothetical protein
MLYSNCYLQHEINSINNIEHAKKCTKVGKLNRNLWGKIIPLVRIIFFSLMSMCHY